MSIGAIHVKTGFGRADAQRSLFMLTRTCVFLFNQACASSCAPVHARLRLLLCVCVKSRSSSFLRLEHFLLLQKLL